MNPVLKLLLEGAHLTTAQMAQVAGLSESEVNEHLEQLKKERIFLGWRPVLDLSREAAADAAVRAVIEFVRARYDGSIIVGEGAALSPTFDGFRNFGYESLIDEYGVDLMDLNADDMVPVQILMKRYNLHFIQNQELTLYSLE